jgi:antitoxin component YwqK of YwqJK toxin-antitoxin module
MNNRLSYLLRGILMLVVVLSCSGLNAQDKINAFDANGKRTGVWKKYYNNNRIRYHGQFEAGKEVGVFKFYSALNSDHPVVIKVYNGDNSLVKAKFYSVEGVLESEGAMEVKERVGKWLYYHKDGKKVIAEEIYQKGELNGESRTFYENGKVTEILNYKNGKLHGKVKRYSEEGTLLDDLLYSEGKMHGLAKYFNAKGELIYTGNYENDEKVGQWEYFENGKSEDVNKIKQ